MKIFGTIFLWAMVTFLVSCGRSDKPAGLLSEDKMVEVLVDVHLAEGLVSSFPINYDSSRVLYPMFEKEVFVKHQVPDSLFRNSLAYYIRDAKTMDRLYTRIIDSLHVIEKGGNDQ